MGMKVGRPVCAVLFALARGPIMVYHGQEVGEPAAGREGFGGDDARTTIFDYWSMPEFTKWFNGGKCDGGRLSDDQKSLRAWYGRLLAVTSERAFTHGEFYGLNHANKENPAFGRLGDESVSGHWLYAFLRRDPKTGQAFLVVANFHGSQTLRDVKVRIPADALMFLGHSGTREFHLRDRLDLRWTGRVAVDSLATSGVSLPELPPCSAMFIELSAAR